MSAIRNATRADLDALYEICLLTGDAGKDATALYDDPQMMGHIYMAPYVVLSPQTSFVVEDDAGVCGYVAGTFDTRAFEALMESDWWPQLRARYPDPAAVPEIDWTLDQRRAATFHHPVPIPDAIVAAYPAHMHLNMHPRVQGRGLGRALCEHWLELARKNDVRGVHVGVNALNPGGQAFWRTCGFADPVSGQIPGDRAVFLGQFL